MILTTAPPTLLERQTSDPTRILVPYIPGMLHVETVQHVLVSGREATFVDLDPADPCAYARLIDLWWNRGTDLVVIEQDMVPPYGCMGQMAGCPLSVCTFRYDCGGRTKAHGLGTIRFRAQLQARYPSLAAQAGGATAGRVFSTHWRALNERLLDLCARFGAPAHIHSPDAGHLHDYSREAADAGT